jgi:hypothetical protein
LTRHEYEQLREIYSSLLKATVQLSDMIIFACHDFVAEDAVNTALEQSNNGADHDDKQRPV